LIVNANVWNRILLLLAFAGIFVAGTLSMSHILNIVVPCGPGGGCQEVTTHASAYWFKLPVAYFGLGAYLALAALAVLRAMGTPLTRKLAIAGYVIAALGTVLSVILQYVAINEIRARCDWCLASAGIMVLTLIAYALYVRSLDEVETPPKDRLTVAVLPAALVLVSAIGLTAQGMELRRSERFMVPSRVIEDGGPELVPKQANSFGEPDAPITIIEFADFGCGGCKDASPKVKELVRHSNGRIRLVYRHFPLDMHPASLPAAIISEYAAEKGRFWEFAEAAFRLEEKEPRLEDYMILASGMGLDPAEIEKRMADTEDPIFNRVFEDIETAKKLGFSGTPIFVVQAPGQPTRSMGSRELMDTIGRPPYSQIQAAP
jgi:uncharacterized membrane protein